MNVLVDTSVWSLALRRRRVDSTPEVAELGELIREGRARIIGAVRQEILSGLREEATFVRLRDRLRSFPDLVVSAGDHERAAEYFNRCRRVGLQGSNSDFLICAAAHRHRLAIFTTDADFERYTEHLPLRLHAPRVDR